MTQITGGEVTYERRVTTGEYQHKHLKVTLSFIIDEGNVNTTIDEGTLARAIRLVEEGLRMRLELPADPLMETGMAAAVNGMEFLKKWWLTVPAAKRDELKEFKDRTLKPMAEKADQEVGNNLRAG